MDEKQLADFMRFAQKYRYKFRKIAEATKNEYSTDDVQSEAWILIDAWLQEDPPISLDSPEDINRLFGYLYSKLVKHTEKKIRYSTRFEHYAYGEADEPHPLLNQLSAPTDTQPLEMLLALEAAAEQPAQPESHVSRASAYLYLVELHKNNMKLVADHLLISLSYCYYRLREARTIAITQYDLPDTVGKLDDAFVPGPWRSFRLSASHTNLTNHSYFNLPLF